MRKDAQAVLLLLIGGTLLKISITGTYVRYVKPGQLPLLVIAGVVLIVIAGATLWQVIRPRSVPTAVAEEEEPTPSGFEDLAERDEPPAIPAPIEEREPVSLSALRDPDRPRPGALRDSDSQRSAALRDADPQRSAALRDADPQRSAALRDADRLRSGVGDPDRAAMSALRDQETTLLPEMREPTDEPVSAEVTYREFTPGELVAVPVGHHLVDRAAHERNVAERTGPQPVAVSPVSVATVEEPDDHEFDHGRVHGEPRVAWLLLLPVLALLLFAPPALGSFQASRNGTALSSQANSDFPPLPGGDPLRISLLDYASRAVFEKGRSLQGRQLKLSGFVIAGPDGQPYLARMVVTCCAADGRPVKVGLAGDLPTTLKPDEWIEIEGGYIDRSDKDPVNAELVPYIQVTSVRKIPAPDQQYES